MQLLEFQTVMNVMPLHYKSDGDVCPFMTESKTGAFMAGEGILLYWPGLFKLHKFANTVP